MEKSLNKLLENTLEQFWGYSSFRPIQSEIIHSLMQRLDTLALLPTGGGKSLCYQLPAVLLEGTALVVSPLLALMKEQVQQLNFLGISAAFLSSEFDDEQEEQIYTRLKNDEYKILYISPERLLNATFLENIVDVQLSFLAVDEAHCISEWGSDFRPSYQNIKAFRENFDYLPCIALTGTASVKVAKEIQTKLGFENAQIFRKSFRRDNLTLQVRELGDKYQHIFYYLKENSCAGLIYVRTRRAAEDLANWLQHKGIVNIDFYHAGLSSKEKHSRQNRWLSQNNYTLVSTNAFGMGIDKQDVGFVIHLSPPSSIENYYQEIGRAGRNGNEAEALMLWNHAELRDIDGLYKSQMASKSEYENVISCVYSKCLIAEHEMPEDFFEINTSQIHEITKVSRSKVVSILRFLQNQEIIYLKESDGPSSLKLKFEIHDADLLGKNDAHFIEALSRVLEGFARHRVYFREKKLSEKLRIDEVNLKLRLKELHRKDYLDYFDGSSMGIRFLTPRNDREMNQRYWKIFESIQKNKVQKWEEIKYFLKENSFCKMRMILAYFGESSKEDCGKCTYCLAKNTKSDEKTYKKLIFEALMQSPSTLDEITVRLKYYPKEQILDHLKNLLDKNQVKMLDFKTYSL